ncbi:MAG: hypothetical protein RMJ98_15690 [Myxococcales bacterium]|nr:hypothetical protein [Polyangiaceae bacterium]MDW8250738.1 hypothetical protein [Myxococcales bacterium]
MKEKECSRDAFCAVALMLGFPAHELEPTLGGEVPSWVLHYRAASTSQARAVQLAPHLLAVRLAVEQGWVRWA